MSPKDILDFDTEDDIIELTDIVEQGALPAMHDAADDLFDAGGGEIDFEKELEDLFSDNADTLPPSASSTPKASSARDGDGLDFESDLDDLLGSLDTEDRPAAPAAKSSAAQDDDDFSAELDDLLGGLDEPDSAPRGITPSAPADTDDTDDSFDADLDALLGSLDEPDAAPHAAPAKAPADTDDSFDADLDALLGGLDEPDVPAPKKAPASIPDPDDLLSELGLGTSTPSPSAPEGQAASDSDIDFSELDALIQDMEVPKGGKPAPVPHEDDGLPDLSDLDSLFEESAAAEAMLNAKPSRKPLESDGEDHLEALDEAFEDAMDKTMDDDMDLDSLLDSLDSAIEHKSVTPPAPAEAAGSDNDSIDEFDAITDEVVGTADTGSTAASDNFAVASDDIDDIDSLLESLDEVPAPDTAPSRHIFDPNESLSAPDMGELDALLEDLGAESKKPASGSDMDFMDTADSTGSAGSTGSTGDEDIPDLDDILGVSIQNPPDMPDEVDLPDLDDLDTLLADGAPDELPQAPTLPASGDADLELIEDDLADTEPDSVDIDALLDDLDTMSAVTTVQEEEPDTSAYMGVELDTDISPDLLEDIADLAELAAPSGEEGLDSLEQALKDAETCVAQDAPELASILARITALEQMFSPSDERIEDIVARKIAESAAEDEACIANEKPSVMLQTIEDAMAEGGPIMSRIASMIDQKIDDRLSILEKTVFTHRDWNTHSQGLRDEFKANIEKSAAKAAADIIREELSALLSEE